MQKKVATKCLKMHKKILLKDILVLQRPNKKSMLKVLGFKNLDDLVSKTVPEKILLKENLNIGDSNSEYKALRKLKEISKKK